MNIGMSRIVSAAGGALLFASAACAADFSAEMVSSSPQGAMTAKMYMSDQKSRIEMPGAVTIARMDKKVMWMLMPAQKMYIEQPIDMHTAMSTQEKLEGEIERTVEGTETVNGMNTTKYRVTYEAAGKRETIFQWIDGTNRFPVKTASVDGSWWSEFRNINTGAQDPALFEIPAGYNKMSLDIPDMSGMTGRNDS